VTLAVTLVLTNGAADDVTADDVTADEIAENHVTENHLTANRVTANRITANKADCRRHAKGAFRVREMILFPRAPHRPLHEHRPVGRSVRGSVAILCLVLAVVGCSRAQTPKMPLTPAAPDPVAEAKSLLQAYGGGQPLGSESVSYEDLIKRVTAVDAGKGAKLKAFADEALQKGKVDAAKAKKLAAEL